MTFNPLYVLSETIQANIDVSKSAVRKQFYLCDAQALRRGKVSGAKNNHDFVNDIYRWMAIAERSSEQTRQATIVYGLSVEEEHLFCTHEAGKHRVQRITVNDLEHVVERVVRGEFPVAV